MGGLKLNAVFSDGMVFQRGREITVWGTCDGGGVTVSLRGETVSAEVKDGRWTAVLPPMAAAESVELTVSAGNERIVVKDAAIGEVWIAAGQSNMELDMSYDAESESASDSDPLFRFFDVPRKAYEGMESDVDLSAFGFWRKLGGEDTKYFSAAGYYFGRKLRGNMNVPVGIVGCNCGGTSASCWVPEDVLSSDPELNGVYLETYRKTLESLDIEKYNADYIKERVRQQQPGARAFHRRMMTCTLTESEHAEVMANSSADGPVVGPVHHYRPSGLFHTMLETIIPYTARGVIWYQGESDDNPERAPLYAKLFTKLIERWRLLWGYELPFLFVQLAPFESWLMCAGERFPEVRRQQETVSKTVPNTYMASIMDSGERLDIHPKRKRPAGERLARLALAKVYGFDAASDAPEAVSCAAVNGGAEVRFINCGEGLSVERGELNGLQAFGAGGAEFEVTAARADGDRLIISARGEIKEVRFAWTPYVDANLYGNGGLCAKPFRFEL